MTTDHDSRPEGPRAQRTGADHTTTHSTTIPLNLDPVDAIIQHENGTLGARQTFALYGHLIRSGLAWSLQSAYGRAAGSLIRNGFLTTTGDVTARGFDALDEAEAEDYGSDSQ